MSQRVTLAERDRYVSANVRAHELARIVVWTSDLSDMLAHHDAMESDVDALFADGKINPAAYGDQSATVLQSLPGDHWKAFFGKVKDVVIHLVAAAPERIDESTIYLRAWASRLRSSDGVQSKFQLQSLHNHHPAFLSAVYYLRLPQGSEPSDSGTVFINPFCHPLQSPHPGISIVPSEGRLVAFPSGVMHAPMISGFNAGAGSRIVLGIDAHFVPR